VIRKQKRERYYRRVINRAESVLPVGYGKIAKILSGAPLPPAIFIGSAKIVAPFAGNRSIAATFSKIGTLAAPRI
jgi:hypothetical protein